MRVVSILELEDNIAWVRDELIRDLKAWACMIYPTDTVYWIGTIDDERYTHTVWAFKERDMDRIPYSIIAPSFSWIDETYPPSTGAHQKYSWMHSELLRKSLHEEFPWRWITCIFDREHSWVRHLNSHTIQTIIEAVWQPFITTSANLTWHPTITEIKDLDSYPTSKKALINRCIDWGVLDGPWSVIIDVVSWTLLRA